MHRDLLKRYLDSMDGICVYFKRVYVVHSNIYDIWKNNVIIIIKNDE